MNLKHRADEILGIQKEAIQKLEITDSWVKSIEIIKSVAENDGRIVSQKS